MTCPRMFDFLSHSDCSFTVEVDAAETDEAEGGLSEVVLLSVRVCSDSVMFESICI